MKDQYRLLGENVAKIRTDLMKEQLTTFRSQLEDFARKHKVYYYLFSLLLRCLKDFISSLIVPLKPSNLLISFLIIIDCFFNKFPRSLVIPD